ncbi:MAG: hypothetical protein ACLSAH_20545 [Bilophila wadsworthia]
MLRMLASELEQGKSSDSGRIRSKLKTFLSDTGNLSALIFEDGTGYVDSGLAVTLTPQEMETFKGLHESSGLLFPHRNRGTGRRTFTIYTVVDFPDGRKAYLFKGYNVETLYAPMPCPSITIRGFPMWWPRTAILPCAQSIPPATRPFPTCLISSARARTTRMWWSRSAIP